MCKTPEATFDLGEKLGESLHGGEVVLLTGGLGAGKTLFTKGILNGLEYDIDEVTSPSFTLVNQYDAQFTVYHIDLWRLTNDSDAAFAVGLDEILADDRAVVVIEWPERLNRYSFSKPVIHVEIIGDGIDERAVKIIDARR